MVRQPDGNLLLVIAIRSATFQPLKQPRHNDDCSHDTDTGHAEPHGDRAHQTRQEEANG